MNYDEFAFANQQLAGMLKVGIPLEGALKQLSTTMQRGLLRGELEKLQHHLAQGMSLRDAVAECRLPAFYVRMLQIGAQSNDLPGILTLLADYYQRKNLLATRLKGLLVYPAIVLVATLALSTFLALSLGSFAREVFTALSMPAATVSNLNFILFGPMFFLILISLTLFIVVSVPGIRNRMRWRMIGFREANLSNFAACLQLLLKNGATLDNALGLISDMEQGTPLRIELQRWQKCLATGRVKSTDLAAGSTVIPPLFFWLIAGDEENWVTGLGRAAELYYRRASHKIDTLLYAALPVSILVLGSMVISEIYPVVSAIIRMMDTSFDVP